MNQNIRNIIFDFGGVIFVNPQHPEMTKVEHDEIWAAIQSLADEYQSELLADTFTLVRFSQLFRERTPSVQPKIREHVLKSVGSPNTEVVEIIDRCHQQYSVYGLVNASPGWTELRRGINGLDRHFSRVLASHEVQVRKPDPKIFHHLLNMINAPAGSCLFIDDQPENITAASDLGFATHHFQSAEFLAQRIRDLSAT